MPRICDLPVWSPLYLVRSTQACPRCGRAAEVVGLVSERYDDTLEGSAEAEQALGPLGWLPPILLAPVDRLPPGLADAVHALAPHYRRVRSPDGAGCFANHCECGTVLGDDEVYGTGGAFDVRTGGEMEARGIEAVVLPLPRAERIACDWLKSAGIAFILQEWCRGTVGELLARLQESVKPTGRPYAVAVARVLRCLDQAELELEAWREGRDPFEDAEYPAPGPEEATSLEPWADMQVWEPLFLMTSVYRCWRCGENSPVAAVLAERWIDLIGSERQARRDPLPDAQHVVMLSGIERMSAGLELALAEAAPHIRRGRSRTAERTYYMNHCRACGAHFGDFFLGDAGGPFWAWSPDEIQAKGISLSLLDVRGMQELRCGAAACDVYVWAHEQWWRERVRRLIQRLRDRDDSEARDFAAALARAAGELACVEREIEIESARVRRAASDPVPG